MEARKLYPAKTPYVVRATDGVIAESRNAIILSESGHSDRVFFPKSDVAMVLFDQSETTAKDPNLGEMKFYHLSGKSDAVIDVAWSYENADGDYQTLAGLITFDSDKLTVEAL